MQFRNAKFNAVGTVDCEIQTEAHGWIPFTCDPNDAGADFDVAELFAQMSPIAAPYVAPTAAELDAEQAAKDARRIAAIKGALDDQNSVNKVLLKIGFLQENRIRALEGASSISATQCRAWVDGQIE